MKCFYLCVAANVQQQQEVVVGAACRVKTLSSEMQYRFLFFFNESAQ